MRLHDVANAAHTEIESHQEQRRQAYKTADTQFMESTKGQYRALDGLEAKYSNAAFKIACDLGKAPLTAQGQPQEPSTISAERDGLLLTWGYDNSSCSSNKATWDDLEQAQAIAEADN